MSFLIANSKRSLALERPTQSRCYVGVGSRWLVLFRGTDEILGKIKHGPRKWYTRGLEPRSTKEGRLEKPLTTTKLDIFQLMIQGRTN